MSQQALKEEYYAFHLDRYLCDEQVDIKERCIWRQPVVLLSQVQGLNRSIVEQLERSGIYDSDDFITAGPQIQQFLEIDQEKLDEFLAVIQQAISRQSNLPRVVLDLPANYVLVSLVREEDELRLGLLWSGLEIMLTAGSWQQLGERFVIWMEKMGHPELVGRIKIHPVPGWFKDVIPVSTYLSNVSPTVNLATLAKYWGLELESLNEVREELWATAYLIMVAQQENQE